MRSVQSIDIYNDSLIVISGINVVGDNAIAVSLAAPITGVTISFLDVTAGNSKVFTGITLTPDTATNSWSFTTASIIGSPAFFFDGHKYVGQITKSGTIQPIRIQEFVVDLHSLDMTLVNLPYILDFVRGYKIWFKTEDDFTDDARAVWYRSMYKGNTGLVKAAHIGEVTHYGTLMKGPVA